MKESRWRRVTWPSRARGGQAAGGGAVRAALAVVAGADAGVTPCAGEDAASVEPDARPGRVAGVAGEHAHHEAARRRSVDARRRRCAELTAPGGSALQPGPVILQQHTTRYTGSEQDQQVLLQDLDQGPRQ